MQNINKGFTFIELVVTVTILSILSTIWFVSYSWYIETSRNSTRVSDMTTINISLKQYKNIKWQLPIPENYFKIENNWVIIAWQGKIWKNTSLSTLDDIPLDPKMKIPYFYSISSNKKEFNISLTIEDSKDENEKALLIGTYKSISKNILPTIMLAKEAAFNSSVEINSWTVDWIANRKLFIFNEQTHNLPYSFINWENPQTDWSDFDVILNEAIENKEFYQNSSFETCDEISVNWKSIWDWEYQIRSNTWALTNTGCTF